MLTSKTPTVITTLLLVAVTACNHKSASTESPIPPADNTIVKTTGVALPTGDPVQTAPAEAKNLRPYFAEQTRAPEVLSNISLTQNVIASGLNHPWGIQFLPDGRMLVTERSGQLRLVTQHGEVSPPITGVPKVWARGQGGLLDVNISPTFKTDRMVFLSYAEDRGDNTNGTTVARGRLNENNTALEQVEVIFRQMPGWNSNLHYGSRLVWSPEGHLYVTLGERSNVDARVLAQDLDTHLGKVVRIHADGSSPLSNPYADGDGLPEIWSYGHRNIQGAAIHPETGALWTIEHGPRGGDELNTPQPGKNYGWPVITYGIEYGGDSIGKGITQKHGMEQPVYYWDPVIAPGGMTFYSGALFKAWKGNLFIGALRARGLVRLMLEGDRVVGEERLLTDVGRVRDVTEGPEGALWILTDSDDGKVLKLGRY